MMPTTFQMFLVFTAVLLVMQTPELRKYNLLVAALFLAMYLWTEISK